MAQSKKNQPASRTVKAKAASSKAAATESAAKTKKPATARKTATAGKAVAKKAPAKSAAAKPAAKKKPAAKPTAAKKAAPKAAKPTASAAKAKPAAKKKPVAAKPAASAKSAAKKPVAAAKKSAAPKAVKKKPAATTREIIAAAAAKRSAASMQRAVPASVGKAASGSKITAAVGGAKKAAPKAAKVVAPEVVAGPKKPVSQRHGFKISESVVYPSHGVGRIVGIEEQEIAGMALELFVINFEKEKLTLRVPTSKLESVGMRKLSEDAMVKKALTVLKGRARVKRTMWSRRAQEYVAKINSGDLISIAEVVRDLYRSDAQPEQSYSERQLYEDALDRMAREVAAVEKLDDRGAVQRIVEILSKSAKTRVANEEAAAAAAASEEDGDTDGASEAA